MLAASLVGIFVIPPLYVSFQWLREKLRPSLRKRYDAPASDANKAPVKDLV
jgi:hypothetical protein